MPALNIRFTEAEIALIRKRAQTEGVSMTTLVHDTTIRCASAATADDRIMDAVARVARLSASLLARLADK